MASWYLFMAILIHAFRCFTLYQSLPNSLLSLIKLPAFSLFQYSHQAILLANINQLADAPNPDEPRISADGQFLLLEDDPDSNQSHASVVSPDPSQPMKDGNAASGDDIEGLESEAWSMYTMM